MNLFFILILNLGFAAPEVPPAKKNQLEELFIWKLSDELKLGPAEEKKFSELVRQLNQKKLKDSQKIEQVTKEFQTAKTDKDKEAVFKNLKKAYQEYNQLSVLELDEMKKLLGPQRLSTYLNVKQDLTAKVKSLLIQKTEDKDNRKDLPPPKVIEENKSE